MLLPSKSSKKIKNLFWKKITWKMTSNLYENFGYFSYVILRHKRSYSSYLLNSIEYLPFT